MPPSPDQEPSQPSHADGLDLHADFHSEPTGGDVFDTLRLGSKLAFVIGDIAGRRPELDPIAVELQRVFRATSTELLSAHTVNLMEFVETLILAINQALIGMAKGVRFAPTFVGCYDVQLGILAYINAGGQTAIFRDSEGTRPLPNVSMPLGLFTHLTYDASIQAFEPGAMLLVTTKGVTESIGSAHPERITTLLQNSEYESASAVCSAILAAAHHFEKSPRKWLPFRGKSIHQDMTAFAMLRKT